MRELIWLLTIIVGGLLALFVLLPILGIAFLVVAAVVLLALAAPFLSRLPFFRRWIRVERYGNVRTVRFGRGTYMSYEGQGAGPAADDDVIDVDGREVPEDEPKRIRPPEL